MYDNCIWGVSLGAVFLIGNAELGVPSILEGVGSTAIVGFVVWFMMTKMNESLKELTRETKTPSRNWKNFTLPSPSLTGSEKSGSWKKDSKISGSRNRERKQNEQVSLQ